MAECGGKRMGGGGVVLSLTMFELQYPDQPHINVIRFFTSSTLLKLYTHHSKFIIQHTFIII
jgi:hypothetical protein